MGLLAAFQTSVTGLRVSQGGLQTVSHNVSNADTEGYSRQRVEAAAYDPARRAGHQLGRGAYIDHVARAHENFVEFQVIRDRTLQGYYGGREGVLAMVERLYSEAAEPTIGGSISEFFNFARELSQDPSSFGARSQFVQSARDVAGAFRTLDDDLRQAQHGIDDTLQDRIGQINENLRIIAEMNAGIVKSEVDGSMANDFRDRRDLAVREIASFVDISVLPHDDGTVSVELANRFVLVQKEQVARLEGVPNAGNFGLLDVQYIGVSGNRVDVTQHLDEGEIGGLLDVRDTVIERQLALVDQLANTFITEVNAVHRQGFGLDGVGGRDLFVAVAGVPFSAANIAVDPAIDADPLRVGAALDPTLLPGDNRNLLDLADLQNVNHAAFGDVPFNRRYAELLHEVGSAVRVNADRAAFHDVRASQAEALRESVVGVSIDDEMIDLTKFQKHFEANSRVVTTVQQLLDTVLQLLQ